jgi:hypothetical protein
MGRRFCDVGRFIFVWSAGPEEVLQGWVVATVKAMNVCQWYLDRKLKGEAL